MEIMECMEEHPMTLIMILGEILIELKEEEEEENNSEIHLEREDQEKED